MPIIDLGITEDREILPLAIQDLTMNTSKLWTNPHIVGILLFNLRVNRTNKNILTGNLK